jgi:hypothetical protein
MTEAHAESVKNTTRQFKTIWKLNDHIKLFMLLEIQ